VYRLLFEEPDESESINDLAKQDSVDEIDALFSDSTPTETETFEQLFCSTEPEEDSIESLAVDSHNKGREYISQVEFDLAIDLGMPTSVLPKVRDFPKEEQVEGPHW
jgi:hypothetical protein